MTTLVRSNPNASTFLRLQGKPLDSPSGLAEKTKVKEALEKERAKQMALVAKAQEQSSKDQENNHRTDLMKAAAAKKALKDAHGAIHKNNSGVSLDYSVDSHSFLAGDGSTLLGGKFATDGSVTSASTRGTFQHQAKQRSKQDPLAMPNQMSVPREDDETSGFSIQESTSTADVVPSDEDLFAVGWAKALDPKSGSYYYFTLDRSKIVWDNPLAPGGASMDDETTEASSLPEGAIMI